jgi:hypothetical protein
MATKEQLSLYIACHDFVLGIDVRGIERLVLPEEVSKVEGAQAVQVGRRRYAPFNLGTLFEMAPTSGATVLVRTLYAGAELSFALETGPCLLVRKAEATRSVPEGLFRGRRRALGAAFVVPPNLRVGGRAPIGFTLNVDELLDVSERDAASKLQASLPVPVAANP